MVNMTSEVDERETLDPAVVWLKPYLSKWACQIAGRFNSPVYLVGSALYKEYPRDVDVVVILSNQDFVNRYGFSCDKTQDIKDDPDESYLRYWNDVAKLTGWASGYHNLNLDFKIQDRAEAERFLGDRIRLDCLRLDN